MEPLLTVRPDSHGLLRRSTLRSAGYGDAEIDRMRRTGRLLGVRRGVYRQAGDEERSAVAAHALRSRAAAPELSPEAVFGFATAAALLGLPLWRTPLKRLHAIRDRSGGGRRSPGIHVHVAPLPDEDVIEIGGIRLTTAARTVADLARTLPFEQALVAADGALHKAGVSTRRGEYDPGSTTADIVTACLARFAGRRGSPQAGRIIAFADGLSESPGETRSRLRMHLAGLPPPVTQWPIPGTRFRADFGWPELGLVGEFDGLVKYGRGLRPGEDIREVVWREKRREDEIRDTGLGMIRWIWTEIDDDGAEGLIPRLARRLDP